MPTRVDPPGTHRDRADSRGYSLALVPEGTTPIYIAGQTGLDDTGTLVEGGLIPQYRQALANVERLVEAADATMADVVAVTIYVTSLEAWKRGDPKAVKDEFFAPPYPTSTLVEVAGLADDAMLVEVSAVAYR